jgi:hypothetical protein
LQQLYRGRNERVVFAEQFHAQDGVAIVVDEEDGNTQRSHGDKMKTALKIPR